MHTSAPQASSSTEADLFEAIQPIDAQYFEGELVADAEVRYQTSGHDYKPRVVVCLNLRSVNGQPHTMHAEWPFDNHHRAEAYAKTYKRSMRIRLATVKEDLHIVLRHVHSTLILN